MAKAVGFIGPYFTDELVRGEAAYLLEAAGKIVGGYDVNDNRTLHRTRAGQDIVMGYDALDRMLTRSVPAERERAGGGLQPGL